MVIGKQWLSRAPLGAIDCPSGKTCSSAVGPRAEGEVLQPRPGLREGGEDTRAGASPRWAPLAACHPHWACPGPEAGHPTGLSGRADFTGTRRWDPGTLPGPCGSSDSLVLHALVGVRVAREGQGRSWDEGDLAHGRARCLMGVTGFLRSSRQPHVFPD